MEKEIDEISRADRMATRDQKDLIGKLAKYGDGAVISYRGALHAYYSRDYPDRTSHFAYSLRDAIDILSKYGRDMDKDKHSITGDRPDKDKGKDKGKNKGKGHHAGKEKRKEWFPTTFDSLTGQEYGQGDKYDALAEFFKKLSNIGHQKTRISDYEMGSILTEVEDILHPLVRYQDEINGEVDRIIHRGPSAEGAERLMLIQTNGATHIYVTRSLTPDWLHHMAEARYFKNPKEGEYWIAHQYLARCAKFHPEEAAKITTQYSSSTFKDHPDIYFDLVRCVPDLHADHAEAVARHMLDDKWYKMFHTGEESYIKVARHMYLSGRYGIASDMLRCALCTTSPDSGEFEMTRSVMAQRGLDELVLTVLKGAGKIDLVPMLVTLVDLLDYAIRSGTEGFSDVTDSESSMFWCRPSIERSEDNWICDIVSSLVDHITDCLLVMGAGDPRGMDRAMSLVGSREYLVWRRIEMFVYRRFPDRFSKEAGRHAVRYLGHKLMRGEDRTMIGRCFAGMSDGAKRDILERMDGGIDDGWFRRVSTACGREAAEAVQDRWRLRYLGEIKGHLDTRHRETYEGLVKKYGGTDPLQDGADHDGDGDGPSGAGFRDLDEALGIMAGWEPDGSGGDPGTGAFSDVVSGHPLEASRRAAELAESHPDIQEAFFRGLEDAVRRGAGIDWGPVITMMEGACPNISGGAKEGWNAAFEICRMLRRSFSRGIPGREYRRRLWGVVKAITGAAITRQDVYRRTFEVHGDGHNISTNSLGGLSFHVLVLYAIWAAKGDGGGKLDRGVRDVIDGYVGDEDIHTVARSSALGRYLPHLHALNRDWTVDMSKKIRESDTINAFWEGYVRRNHMYLGVFSDLRHLYGQFLNADRTPEFRSTEMFKATFDHILLAYLYGADGARSMFCSFIRTIDEESPEKLIDHCVFRIGTVARGEYCALEFDACKMEELWRHPVLLKRDLSGWFVGSKMGRKASILMYLEYVRAHTGRFVLTHMLMDELETYVDGFRDEVFECLDLLVVSAVGESIPHNVIGLVEALERAGRDCRIIRERIKSRAY